ncbi:MAG TPA: glycoside hydrolase family 57 protein [Puia sp.]|nr:glycoside hydrolase family 57 protein [Puia sp.]
MISLCLYFKVHQPFQLKQYYAKDIDVLHSYENTEADIAVINKLADECYLPANEIILSNILETKGKFKISYSISGTVLELLLCHRPDVIDSFKEIISTGCAEILAETYYSSLSYLYSKKEFQRQIEKHQSFVKEIFGVQTTIFRNTELIYDNKISEHVVGLGLKGVLCEGASEILKGRSPNHVYAIPNNEDVKLLLRTYVLSDDIAFRFDDARWNEHPLTADKFASWIHNHPPETDVINLFMDYETFGIHKKKETGIFDFLKALPSEILKNASTQFSLPSEIIAEKNANELFDSPQTISWENNSGILNPWSSNVMQNNTLKKIYSLENIVLKSKSEAAIDMWGKLQAADYFHYMADEQLSGEAYKYINPFNSAKEVYQYYTNIVFDFEINLIKQEIARSKKKLLRQAIGAY